MKRVQSSRLQVFVAELTCKTVIKRCRDIEQSIGEDKRRELQDERSARKLEGLQELELEQESECRYQY